MLTQFVKIKNCNGLGKDLACDHFFYKKDTILSCDTMTSYTSTYLGEACTLIWLNLDFALYMPW